MSKKDEILGTEEPQDVMVYDLTDAEKNELGALVALVDQARLAQDLIYTRIVQAAAARCGVTDSTVEVDMKEVYANGVANAKLRATKVEKPEEDKALDEVQETSEEASTEEVK